MNRRKLAVDNPWVRAPLCKDTKEIPDEIFAAAKKSLEKDRLIRYFCKKYCMPSTDSRLLAYTLEDMYIEYIADAIEEGRIEMGAEGKPAKRVMYKGEEILETGNPIFDTLEREWIDQGDMLADIYKEVQEKEGNDG